MVHPLTQPRQLFNAYHQNNSLMFQFILFEYIHLFCEAKMINQCVQKVNDKQIQSLKKSIQVLSGSSLEYMRYFSWNQEDGILAKLKCYSSFFVENADIPKKTHLSLEQYSNQAWKLCIESLDIIRLITSQPRQKILYETLPLKLGKLMSAIKKIEKLIERLSPSFHLMKMYFSSSCAINKSWTKSMGLVL